MPSSLAAASATALPKLSHRESDDDYRAVVAVLNERWRVIADATELQWILQSSKKKGVRIVWEGRSFCSTRRALLRLCHVHAGHMDPAALTIIQRLPTYFPEGRR